MFDLDLDVILDQAIAEGELMVGMDPALVAFRNPGVMVSPELTLVTTANGSRRWSPDEMEFVRRWYGRYTDAEIGAVLGRSEVGVKLYRKRHLGIPGLTKHPDFITAQAAAYALGVDIKGIAMLQDREILPDWWQVGEREVRLMRKVTFYRWAVNPYNWVYFIRVVHNPARMGDPHLRRLIERQWERWDDDWWSTRQVADYHGVDHTDVNRLCHQGKIKSVKWNNRWILRSEATRSDLIFFKGKGSHCQSLLATSWWTPAAEDFLLQARDERGLSWASIARLMKRNEKTVPYHYKRIKERRGEL